VRGSGPVRASAALARLRAGRRTSRRVPPARRRPRCSQRGGDDVADEPARIQMTALPGRRGSQLDHLLLFGEQEAEQDEIHVCHAVLEAGRNEGGDGTIARILSTTLRPPVASRTARQTSAFARIPRTATTPNDRRTFPAAMESAVTPTASSLSLHQSAAYTMATIERAPTRLPAYTTAQFRNRRPRRIWPLIQLINTRLLPVKSSAPATTTRTRPSEKASPASSRVGRSRAWIRWRRRSTGRPRAR
jgi:hypothetical protein